MLKKQQDLKLFVFSCQDLEHAFLSYLHFHSIKEDEFVEVLVKLKLLREDNPKDTLPWQNFYSKFKIDATKAGVLKPYYDIISIMIALYLLTSSKASLKAKFIAALFQEFGGGSYFDENYHNIVSKKIKKKEEEMAFKNKNLEGKFKPSQNIKKEI